MAMGEHGMSKQSKQDPNKKMRRERDGMGELSVPADRYWGAQTKRSLHHFSIGRDIMPIEVVHALALLKHASAEVNQRLGVITKTQSDLIQQAADEVVSGKLDDHFPLHVWMTGSGTQSNMNVNEVIANRAIELAGGVMGSKDPIHPNDHVNASQSSNDTFPTAMHIATARLFHEALLPAVNKMREALWDKANAWSEIVKIGRTHMQDAVPLTLGQEFSGYATMLDENVKRLEHVLGDVYALTIGGTAVGTGINTPKGFAQQVAQRLADLTGLPFVSAPNKFAVQGSHDALVMVSATLKTLAVSLYKIANDIRLLSCGPRAGFHELHLPENEPGSSIMPGKVNPTQCEAMAMVAAQVMGYDSAVSLGGAGGYLEMNVYKPLMIFNIVQSVHIMADSCINFTDFLLKGCMPNRKKMETYVNDSLMLVTVLGPVIGYDNASLMAHYAADQDCSLSEANDALKLISKEEFKRIINPHKMAHPHDE
jgi:fumarate hydratase, class II